MIAQRNTEPTGDVHQDGSDDECAPVERARQECGQCTSVNPTQTNEVDPFSDTETHRLAVARTRGETVAAVYRLVTAGLERNFRHAAALTALATAATKRSAARLRLRLKRVPD
jgi:hypothetical protein